MLGVLAGALLILAAAAPAHAGSEAVSVTFDVTTKTYDGTTTATITNITVVGDVDGTTTVTLLSADFGSENQGAGKTVRAFFAFDANPSGDTFAAPSFTSLGTITPALRTVTAVATDKVYDSTTASSVTPTVSGPIYAGDTFDPIQTYDDENVGTGRTLTPSGAIVPGPGRQANNYTLTFVPVGGNEITVRTLSVVATADDKVFDGTDAATVTLSDDRVAGDDLTVTFGSATFENEFVGQDKDVTTTGIAISGGSDAPNYVLGNTSYVDLADITPVLRLDAGEHVFDAGAAGPLYSGITTYLIAAELTGDDLIDVVNVTPRGAQIFKNLGGSGTSLSLMLMQELDVQWSKGGGAIDVDGDGDLDLVLGDVAHVKIAENDGTGTFSISNAFRHGFRQPTVAEPFHSHANPLHPDSEVRIAVSSSSDSDVFEDLLGGTTDGRPHLYIMQPDGAGGWQVYQTLDSFNVDGVVPHDLDGNGYNDLFVSNRSGVWSMLPAFVYKGATGGYTGDMTFDLSTFAFPFSFGPTDRVAGTNFGSYVTFGGFAVGSWHRLTSWNGTFGSWNAPRFISMDPGGAGGFATGEAWASAFADMNWDASVDLVALGRTAPLTLMRLDSDPNAAANRYTTALLPGTSHDLKVRDFDFDDNDAPDVIVGRSDGLWYYHNVNGAAAGTGSPAPPPSPPTAGELIDDAMALLYAALDPDATDPLEADDPTIPNGVPGLSYNDLVRFYTTIALAELHQIDPDFRNDVPNTVFGATDADKVETLRLYYFGVSDALLAIDTADTLTSDAGDEATLADIRSLLLLAAADIVAQGQALGGIGAPFKKAAETRRMARLKKRATKRQYAMLEAMAGARQATDEEERGRLVQRSVVKGRQALGYLRRYYRRMERLNGS